MAAISLRSQCVQRMMINLICFCPRFLFLSIIPTRKMTLTVQTMIPHYNDVMMDAMAFQIISVTIVCSSVYSGADQRKHQSPASLVFVGRIRRWPVNSLHRKYAENISIWWRQHAEQLTKWNINVFSVSFTILWRLYCLCISNDLDYGSLQTVICTNQETNFRRIYASHI